MYGDKHTHAQGKTHTDKGTNPSTNSQMLAVMDILVRSILHYVKELRVKNKQCLVKHTNKHIT